MKELYDSKLLLKLKLLKVLKLLKMKFKFILWSFHELVLIFVLKNFYYEII